MKWLHKKRSRLFLGALFCLYWSSIDSCFHHLRLALHLSHCTAYSNRNLQLALCSNDGQEELDPVALVNRRRRTLQYLLVASVATPPWTALAGVPEIDSSGVLFSPKAEMLSGGSELTRGIPVDRRSRLQPGQSLQSVYDTRFIAYLSRFLLNFDPAAHAWWVKQGLGDTWEEITKRTDEAERKFAEFAESVEVGLADYFVGPYGSYSSLSAAKAGIQARRPAPSKQPIRRSFFETLLKGNDKLANRKAPPESYDLAKQGILNLYTLLKARYTSVVAKRQLAILFSFISSKLQPTREISALLGEADNANVTRIQIIKPVVENEAESRTSSRRGGGYTIERFPTVTVDPPPALGDDYKTAVVEPIMKPTSRVLQIRVLDGGEGYTDAPMVSVQQSGVRRSCQAAAILDRQGHVESIIVLDPGWGYGGRNDVPPKVQIEAPKSKQREKVSMRKAKAIALLEYEIVGVHVVEGGNGYSYSEPPNIEISLPDEDPDWFLAIQEQPELRLAPMSSTISVRAKVDEMRLPDGNIAYSSLGVPSPPVFDDALLERLQRDPLEMLPSAFRPQRRRIDLSGNFIYSVPALDEIPQFVAVLEPQYRAYDPVFGGIGKVPVTKGASQLNPSEYGRLALSGAVCTVLVRTALNPLELIKTKQQLQNDEELFEYARKRSKGPKSQEALNVQPIPVSSPALSSTATVVAVTTSARPANASSEERSIQVAVAELQIDVPETSGRVGTIDLLQSMIELRGPLSLFQSADITFLASLVFGSFGFGATELFRRSFTSAFFSNGDDGSGTEVILLLAAALATVVTAAAASPFELLRVRSMGELEARKWTNVLGDFLSNDKTNGEDFNLKSVQFRDLLPLWSGFSPTLSRELPFAIAKFLTFDLIAKAVVGFMNTQAGEGALPVQVGVGPLGLTISALSGAIAGIAGAIVSHPADLILTKTSAPRKKAAVEESSDSSDVAEVPKSDWREVIKNLTSQRGGIANLFVGLGARATFFFLVIGLQFFLYDYVKTLLAVGSDDLNLILDVFYAVRVGLVS